MTRTRIPMTVAALLLCLTQLAQADGPAQDYRQSSAYIVDLIDNMGRSLATYEVRGRYYVLGEIGQRYTIRVQNLTAHRVEAVVSVDGLDVIDGRAADFRRKRGYIVPAYGDLRVDGFRVSASQVASFRFSSVGQSYAGRTGQARNVGVVGVAIFRERRPPELPVLIDPGASRSGGQPGRGLRSGQERQASAPTSAPTAEGKGRAKAAPPSAAGRSKRSASRSRPSSDSACCDNPSSRPGLGTEFGERRYSAVTWTRFERASRHHPDAMVTLRYNDRSGLTALGISLAPTPSHDELRHRESANPFPGSRFAEPPPPHR